MLVASDQLSVTSYNANGVDDEVKLTTLAEVWTPAAIQQRTSVNTPSAQNLPMEVNDT